MHVSISKNIFIALLLMLLCFTEADQTVLMEKLQKQDVQFWEYLCWPCQRGENKSLWLYFSSRELRHSAVSMPLCMTQGSLIPKEYKVWQFYFLFLPCSLLAVTMKILDFFSLIHQKKINLSAEKQAENCLLTITVHLTFPITWKTENASLYTVTVFVLTPSSLQGFPFYYLI